MYTGNKKTNKHQQGMTFWGTLVVLAALLFLGMLGMKSIPAYTEFTAVKAAIKKVGASEDLSRRAVAESFDAQARIDNIESVKGNDLQVVGDVVRVEYQKVVPLFGNISMLFDFKAESSK
jgi:hypothetical protein